MSLASLCIERKTTLAVVALTLGVDATLFERVDAGRQGIPAPLARAMAALLGVPAGTVEKEAGRVIPDTNAFVTNRAAYRALPPRPELGDKMPPLQLAKPPDPPLPT